MKVITQFAVISVLVHNQDEALRFYTEKLGFEKRSDVSYGLGMRWLTVAPKGRRKPEIALAKPDVALHGEERTQDLLQRIGQGTCCIFDTRNCWRAYERLRAKGVTFVSEPVEQAYGVEAIFTDPDGNKFALLQPSVELHASMQGHAADTAA